MHPLSTTRLIAEGSHRREDPVEKELLALGWLDFNHIPQAQEPLEGEQELFASTRGGDLPYADVVLRGGNLDEEWPYLTGTKEEVEALQEVLGDARWEVEAWTWSEGEEGALKRRMLSSAPSVLHFATHGYAFPNPYSASEFVGREALRTHFRVGEDPLVRTGLILSGGNHSWKGLDTLKALTGEDGVLTAAELANMDLRATELVVLSACETGLGETNGMEGTMGLFRGLKLAGVEEVVQSFWEVPDKETQELMAAFYRELATSQHPGEAFQSAQRTMRTKYPNNPALWAPFILIR